MENKVNPTFNTQLINDAEVLIELIKKDLDKVVRYNNKAAIRRMRKYFMQLKNISHETRQYLTNYSHTIVKKEKKNK